MRHYKTRIVYFTIRTAPVARKYVAKLPLNESDHDTWDPRREYEALVKLSRMSQGSESWRVPEPVGFGLEPRFLVTRYCSGTSMRTLAEPGLRRWSGAGQTATTRLLFQKAGRSLHAMRGSTRLRVVGCEETAQSILLSIDARLRDIDRFYHAWWVPRLLKTLRQRLDRLFYEEWDACASVFQHEYGCHGDYCLQNLLVEEGQPLILLDLEGFRLGRLNDDYATFRFRLERLGLNPLFSEGRILLCWREFHDSLATCEGTEVHMLISYLHRLLARLAWLPNPERQRRGGPSTRIGNCLWARHRLRWLRRFTMVPSVRRMCELLRQDL
jgi:hypothetical protein